MKTNMKKIGAALLAVGLCACCIEARAQTTTTVTTTRGAFTEFVPGSETLVVRTDADPSPIRYVVTQQTNIVDESGAPIAIDRIAPGSPLSVEYATAGDRLVASRVVVQKAVAATAPNVVERTTTTTATTRPVTTRKRLSKSREKIARSEQKKRSRSVRKAWKRLRMPTTTTTAIKSPRPTLSKLAVLRRVHHR
jgi:hypothetical protein